MLIKNVHSIIYDYTIWKWAQTRTFFGMLQYYNTVFVSLVWSYVKDDLLGWIMSTTQELDYHCGVFSKKKFWIIEMQAPIVLCSYFLDIFKV